MFDSPPDCSSVWSSMYADLETALGADSAHAWFARVSIPHIGGGVTFFLVDNSFRCAHIRKNYTALLSRLAQTYTGSPNIEIYMDDVTSTPAPVPEVKESTPLRGEGTTISPLVRMRENQAERSIPALSLLVDEAEDHPETAGRTPGEEYVHHNDAFNFDNFVVGESNKFAHAAALAVANNSSPSSTYNPLLLYGPSGLGKTHLMYAITNKMIERNPNLKAIYINGEDFTNQLIEAIAHRRNVEFRNKYRTADVLLIDDIQFIAGKESTQEEFFHTFNALYQDNKQIILTSDRPPSEMVTLEDRLRTRFMQGLMADISEPDYELRLAILTKKAEAMELVISADVLEFIAQNLKSNIRQLEGIMKRFSATKMLGGPIDMALARSLVPMFQKKTETTDEVVEKILTAVQTRRGLSREELIGTNRAKPIATARNIAMLVIRQELELSNQSIGNIFGNRDHSTVVSNLKAIEKLIRTDPVLEAEVADIRREIKK